MPRNEVMRNLLIQSMLCKGVAPVSKPIIDKTRLIFFGVLVIPRLSTIPIAGLVAGEANK